MKNRADKVDKAFKPVKQMAKDPVFGHFKLVDISKSEVYTRLIIQDEQNHGQ